MCSLWAGVQGGTVGPFPGADSCVSAPVPSATRSSRTLRRIEGTRRRHQPQTCASLPHATYQATSQLITSHELELDHLHSLHHTEPQQAPVSFQQLHHVLTARGSAADVSSNVVRMQHSPQIDPYAHTDEAMTEELLVAADMQQLTQLIQQHAGRLSQEQSRVALKLMLKFQHAAQSASPQAPLSVSQSMAELQQQMHTCLDLLCQHAAPPQHSSNSSSQSSLPSWQPPTLALLAKVMALSTWCPPAVWQQLCQAILLTVGNLHPEDASTLLWSTAKLRQACPAGPASQTPSPVQLSQLMDRVWAGVNIIPTRSIAQALYACAALRHVPSQRCMDSLLRNGLVHRLHEWTGAHLACVSWSVSVLQYQPDEDIMTALVTQSERGVRSFASPASLASMLWSLARMRHAPPLPWMEHFLWQVQRRLSVCDAQTITIILGALARLRYRPPKAWAAAVLRTAAQCLYAPGTAQPNTQPSTPQQPAAFTQAAVNGNRRVFRQHTQSQQQPVAILWPPGQEPGEPVAAGDLQHTAPEQLSVQGQPSHVALSKSTSPARQRRQYTTTQPASQPPAQASVAQLTPAQGPITHPARPHLAFHRQRKGPGASPAVFSQYLWALAKLQLLPRAGYLHRLCAAMGPCLNQFSAGELAVTVWSLQRLRYIPQAHWTAALCTCLTRRLPEASPRELMTVLNCLAGYKDAVQVSEDLYQTLCQCVVQQLPALTHSQLSGVCVWMAHISRCKGSQEGASSLLPHLNRAVSDRLSQLGPRELAHCAWGVSDLASCSGDPSAISEAMALVGVMAAALRQHMGQCTHQDLTQMTVACTLVGHQPCREWLQHHEAAMCQRVSQASVTAVELRPLLDAYEQLGYRPTRLAIAANEVAARLAVHQRASLRGSPGVQGFGDPAMRAHGMFPTPPPQLPGIPVTDPTQQLTPEQHALRREHLRVHDVYRDGEGLPHTAVHSTGQQPVNAWDPQQQGMLEGPRHASLPPSLTMRVRLASSSAQTSTAQPQLPSTTESVLPGASSSRGPSPVVAQAGPAERARQPVARKPTARQKQRYRFQQSVIRPGARLSGPHTLQKG